MKSLRRHYTNNQISDGLHYSVFDAINSASRCVLHTISYKLWLAVPSNPNPDINDQTSLCHIHFNLGDEGMYLNCITECFD